MGALLKRARVLRMTLAAGAFVWVGGCINLPPALEHELDCPAVDAPDNFGSASACAQPATR
jgi:hypothetical protein